MKDNMEQLLQQALSPETEPDPWLNQRIIQKAKENENMNRTKSRIPKGVAVAVLTLLVASMGVLAGWKYLAPKDVAKEFTDDSLAKAFASEAAICINETQEYGSYKITLLGIVSGKDLSEYTHWDDQGNIVDDMSYVVTAIENADGTPRPDVSDENYGEDSFYASPYVTGLAMNKYNAHTFGGGYSEDVIDGVQYRIMECDNVEIFAERGIYFGVSDGTFYNSEAFIMDEMTGEISRNDSYDGLNALFKLPIPAFKGDEEAAEIYLKQIAEESEFEGDQAYDTSAESQNEVEKTLERVEEWTLDEFTANGICVYEESLSVDEKGFISYDYEFENGGGSEAAISVEYLFENPKVGAFEISSVFENEGTCVETFEMLENGDVMLRVFLIK